MAIDEQKAKIFDLYRTATDEVCYAHKRLDKLGVRPFSGKYIGSSEDILRRAIAQAKQNKESVSVFLNCAEVQGLFVVSPGQAPATLTYADFVANAAQQRWDKPIEQQKKEEEFDRFKDYEYRKKIFELYGTASEEVCYAHERLEKSGIKPFSGKYNGDVQDIFAAAMQQAKAENKKVAVNLYSGVMTGLFVVAPDKLADNPDYCKAKFEEYKKNQQKLRWDKPIEQQKIEERTSLQKVGGRG